MEVRAFSCLTLCLGALLGLSAASVRSEEAGPADAGPFNPNRVLDVGIELAPKDWDVLRHEGRGLAMTWSGQSRDFKFTTFRSTATIDGKPIRNVGVRKKGYLGSLSTVRPSLKLDFGEFVAGQIWRGMRRLTLNNDRQDTSHTHQMMGYALFRKAGCPAPRVGFARVTVNGRDLGVYSIVENIDRSFLARHFQDGSGNLYEGQLADFAEGFLPRFERKTNKSAPRNDRSDLEAVVQALRADDAGLERAVAKVIDLDAFLSFWAMEVITGHWDGYAGDKNNYYLYRDPRTGLFYFIPWGADGAFTKRHSFLPNCPDSVYAWSLLTNRLYNHPATRRLYHARLKSLLENVWDETTLLAEVDRIQGLLSLDDGALQDQRDFIGSRKRRILEELSGDGPAWTDAPEAAPPGATQPQPVSGTFLARWGSKDAFLPGKGLSMSITLDDEPQTFTAILSAAGMNGNGDPNLKGTAAVQLYGVRPSGGNIYLGLYLMPGRLEKGTVHFHGFETFGVVVRHEMKTGEYELLGFIGNGEITFTAAGTNPGDVVSGSFRGLFARNPE
jgi:hypothetical protein